MLRDVSKLVEVMFKPDERKVLLANPRFKRAMAEFDGTAESIQRIADCGTTILIPEEKRPSMGRSRK